MSSSAHLSPGPAPPAATVGRAGIAARFRSLYDIGRGGMGRVEVALERAPQGGYSRVVALKRLLPEAARDKRHAEMFLREARLAALLLHPNVVHAFAFGETDGEFFLAMEYVEGEPLSRLLHVAREREGGLPPVLVAFVLAQVCEGLHAAHELRDANGTPLKVVHRDVSPHNVMIGYEGIVKLLDFGVAKIDANDGLTRTGEVKGKTAYMSPEQAMGDALDRRSDLYSVGACLFECLANRRMWDGTDMEILRHLALEAPPRIQDAVPQCPPELASLYTRLVARSPHERPSTALHVARELRAYVASSGYAPTDGDLKTLMTRFFADEANRRRDVLTRALSEADPMNVQALRRSLDPTQGRMSIPPGARDASIMSVASHVSVPKDRGALWLVAGIAFIGLLFGGGGAYLWSAHRQAAGSAAATGTDSPVAPDPATTAPAVPAATDATGVAAASTGVLPPSGEGAAGAGGGPTPAVTDPAQASSAPRARPTAPPPAGQHARPTTTTRPTIPAKPPRPGSGGKSHGGDDVDPNPI